MRNLIILTLQTRSLLLEARLERTARQSRKIPSAVAIWNEIVAGYEVAVAELDKAIEAREWGDLLERLEAIAATLHGKGRTRAMGSVRNVSNMAAPLFLISGLEDDELLSLVSKEPEYSFTGPPNTDAN
jgi:hypothetical protein